MFFSQFQPSFSKLNWVGSAAKSTCKVNKLLLLYSGVTTVQWSITGGIYKYKSKAVHIFQLQIITCFS